ncbi:MAG: hypothetical protein HZA63_02865 [Rhodocyclales bacterium]|jgi:hypothetical protein|nr:hypothetical protein [Rhodocyclales bacterium]
MKLFELKSWVLEDMQRYLDEYETPPPGTTIGTPWSKEKVAAELERMLPCVIDPFVTECFIEDTLEQQNSNPPIRRECWVVAIDRSYGLLFDPTENNFVLACQSESHEWGTIGVRGDAVTTFLAR